MPNMDLNEDAVDRIDDVAAITAEDWQRVSRRLVELQLGYSAVPERRGASSSLPAAVVDAVEHLTHAVDKDFTGQPTETLAT